MPPAAAAVPTPASSSGAVKAFKVVASVMFVVAISIGLSVISLWKEGKMTAIQSAQADNSKKVAEASILKAQAEKIEGEAAILKAQAKVAVETALSGGGILSLRASEVPQNMRASTFPVATSAVPCSAGPGTIGWEKEGMSNPNQISTGFELEPGKCFFGKPSGKPQQLEGHNAFMELYNQQGVLVGRCEFVPAGIAACMTLHEKALKGGGVVRFGARAGGFVKYWL